MTGIPGQVQVGMKVTLHETETGFELILLSADQPGAVVTEVTPEYLLMEDATGDVVTRVPIYLIKAVRTTAPEVMPSAA